MITNKQKQIKDQAKQNAQKIKRDRILLETQVKADRIKLQHAFKRKQRHHKIMCKCIEFITGLILITALILLALAIMAIMPD